MLSQSAIEMAPPFNVVSRYFILGSISLVVSIIGLLFLDFNLSLLDLRFAGFLHFFLLCFVMCIVIGALYQLIPVVLEAPFYTLRGSFVLFLLFFIGSLLLSAGMYLGKTPLMHSGGGAVYISLIWFSLLFLLSFKNVKRWSVVTLFLFFASIWLIVGATLGFISLLAISGSSIVSDTLFVIFSHATIVIFGALFFIIMGVSLVLLPMFSLSHGVSTIYSKIALVLLNVSFLSLLFKEATFAIAGITVSIFLYITQSVLILSSRIRKKREYWFYHLSFAFTALGVSIVLAILSYIYGNEELIKVSLWLFLIGFLLHFIIGHLYKIVPFLVWYEYVSPHVGKIKVPMLHEMIEEKLVNIQLLLTIFGTLLFPLGFLIESKLLSLIGSVSLLAATLMLVIVLYKSYKFKNIGEKNDN